MRRLVLTLLVAVSQPLGAHGLPPAAQEVIFDEATPKRKRTPFVAMHAGDDDSFEAFVASIRRSPTEEFEAIDGIDPAEGKAYVDRYVADELARIRKQLVEDCPSAGPEGGCFKGTGHSVDVGPDGDISHLTRSELEYVLPLASPRPAVKVTKLVPCPATHRCGSCGRAMAHAFTGPAHVVLATADARAAAPGLDANHGRTTRHISWTESMSITVDAVLAEGAVERAFNTSRLERVGELLTRISAEPDGAREVGGARYWAEREDAYSDYDYYAAIYYEEGGDQFDGGAVNFADGDVVVPRRGMLLMFSAGEENDHRVSRVTRGARTALMLWFKCPSPPPPEHERRARELAARRQQRAAEEADIREGL